MRSLLMLLMMLVLVAGCEDAQEPVVGHADPEPIQKAVDDRCQDVDEDVVSAIVEGLRDAKQLVAAQAVESEEKDITFVAAAVVRPGGSPHPSIGIWALRDVAAANAADLLAVDAFAREESRWPDGTRDGILVTDDGGEEAKACLEALVK